MFKYVATGPISETLEYHRSKEKSIVLRIRRGGGAGTAASIMRPKCFNRGQHSTGIVSELKVRFVSDGRFGLEHAEGRGFNERNSSEAHA